MYVREVTKFESNSLVDRTLPFEEVNGTVNCLRCRSKYHTAGEQHEFQYY